MLGRREELRLGCSDGRGSAVLVHRTIPQDSVMQGLIARVREKQLKTLTLARHELKTTEQLAAHISSTGPSPQPQMSSTETGRKATGSLPTTSLSAPLQDGTAQSGQGIVMESAVQRYSPLEVSQPWLCDQEISETLAGIDQMARAWLPEPIRVEGFRSSEARIAASPNFSESSGRQPSSYLKPLEQAAAETKSVESDALRVTEQSSEMKWQDPDSAIASTHTTDGPSDAATKSTHDTVWTTSVDIHDLQKPGFREPLKAEDECSDTMGNTVGLSKSEVMSSSEPGKETPPGRLASDGTMETHDGVEGADLLYMKHTLKIDIIDLRIPTTSLVCLEDDEQISCWLSYSFSDTGQVNATF